MKNTTKIVHISSSDEGLDAGHYDDCPICRLTSSNKEPTLEEVLEAFEEAKGIPGCFAGSLEDEADEYYNEDKKVD